ncbi:MAG: NAD-dependent epimerase/dehydratase family protein [Steroidobacteraceae bacterium]
MKILVTGGTGFTGKALVRRLLDRGHAVVALDHQEGHKSQELRDWGAELVMGSVTDREVVRRCMQGVDVVHHVAAAFRELSVPRRHYHEVNVEGTSIVLEAALAEGVRKFIYCSTCGVHGNVDDPPGGEDAPIQPADYYQQTKYEAEPLVSAYLAKGLKTTTLRPAAIYGPGDPGRFYMIFHQLERGWFPMIGNGQVLYHPLYIDNFLDAFELAMDESKGLGEAYLIADEEYVTVEALVRRAAAAMGVVPRFRRLPAWPIVAIGHVVETICRPLRIEPPIHPRRVDWYRQTRAFRIDKARNELGYRPLVGLDEGLRRACAWYRQEGMLR